MRLTNYDIGLLPKVELHVHLDCSLSYEVVNTLDPGITMQDYRKRFIAPGRCADLNEYIDIASSSIALMQSVHQLTLVVKDLYRQFKNDNVIYAEIRFAPLLHTQGGLTPEAVVETVIAAAAKAQQATGIKGGLILCTLRHFSEEQSLQTIKLVEKYLGNGVVGFDIASDEAGFPIDNHISAFQYAKEKGIQCTAHAGEAKGAESVWETLKNFSPRRIGHGVRSEEDEKLMQHLIEASIHLEICPTSNIQTNIFPDIKHHNVNNLYNKGISLSINTDGRTISDTTCSREYKKLVEAFSWSRSHMLHCNLEAIKAAFTTDAIKKEISEYLKIAYADS